MAKQLNINLAFQADTTQAKTQMQELQNSLTKLTHTAAANGSKGLGITKDVAQAINEVAKLQSMLEQSKTATGGLDLGKFNQSLKQSGIQIDSYARTLSSLGPQGEMAFAQLARSVIHAEVPLRRSNALLMSFKTTLMNTAKWQISSSILHGFIGAVQSAYGYVQDLNESLNNIRIVTGKSVEEMSQFAEAANQAARALSTTTTEYTNASLIYFQQGLDAEEVQKRADVTIKMANVSRQSAEAVSDQLTAVWNNFYDGTESLEYYADAMTALGASTASSSEEIAKGLEKFAAVAETVGLSYEYATAALATVTATTRQSADVVGTAFKTLFARLNDLKLGETLDDGTTLGQYTENLAKVGVNIKDANGQLKDMDQILKETAAKWDDLDKGQQTALAKGVAGIRQYTQFIALMDNWDFMEENLATVENSSGALQEQADIYAESWEAASKRVQAAAQKIYEELLNDEFFIDLTNGFAEFLDVISNTIKGLGGLPGVLTLVTSLLFRAFGKDMAASIDRWAYNIKLRTGQAQEEMMKMRNDMVQSLKTMYTDSVGAGTRTYASSQAFEMEAKLADELLIKKRELAAQGKSLSAEAEKEAQYMIQINQELGKQAIDTAARLEDTQKETTELERQLKLLVLRGNTKAKKDGNTVYNTEQFEKDAERAKKLQIEFGFLEQAFKKLNTAKTKGMGGAELKKELEALAQQASDAGMDIEAFNNIINKIGKGSTATEILNSIETNMNDIGGKAYEAGEKIRTALLGTGMDASKVDAILDQLYASWVDQGIITQDLAEKLRNLGQQGEQAGQKIKTMEGPPPTLGQKIMAVGNLLSNLAMSISSIKGLFDTWNNQDMSFGDKLLSTFTTLGMVIPMVTMALSGNNLALLGSVSASIAAAFGFTGVDIAAKVAAGGVGALWAALWPITLVLALVAGAVALVVVGFNALSDAYNKDAIAAEQAAKAAEDLAKAHEEAKQELEGLKSAFDAYDEAVKALEECTEGTEEWREALEKVNDEALALLEKYPDLAKEADLFTRDKETGMLVLNDEARDRIIKEAEDRVSTTQAAALFGRGIASQAQARSDKTDLRREVGESYGIGTHYTDHGVYYDDYLNVGKILTDNALDLADLTETEYRQKVTELLKNAASDQAKNSANFDSEINNLVNKCVNYQDNINTLATNTEEAANQMLNTARMLADQVLGDEYGAAEKEMASGETAKLAEKYTDAYLALLTDEGTSQMNRKKAKKVLGTDVRDGLGSLDDHTNPVYKYILKELQNAGYNYTAYTGNSVIGDDTHRRLVFTDENGKSTGELSAQWIASTLGASRAMQEMGQSAEQAAKNLKKMDDRISNLKFSVGDSEAQTQGMREFIANKSFENMTLSDFDSMYSTVAGQSGDTTGEITKEDVGWYLDNLLGDKEDGKISNTTAQKYFKMDADEVVDLFYNQMTGSFNAKETFQLPENLIGVDDMTFGAAAKIGIAFKNINLGPLGEEAGEEFATGLNKMIGELDPEQQGAALERLSQIDWSDWDAMEQADAIMKEFGVDIDTGSKEWVEFAEKMRIANGAVPDFTKLKETLNGITAILKDLEFGDVIDEEDYQMLVKYNDEWERFFILQSDGTRKFIGDSSMMTKMIQNSIKSQMTDLTSRKEIQSNFAAAQWGYTDAKSGERITDEDKVWKDRDTNFTAGANIRAATNLMNSTTSATEDMLNLLGYSDERIQEIIDQANSADEKIKATGEAALDTMFDAIHNFTQEDLDLLDSELKEMMASTAQNFTELDEMFKDDSFSIGIEAYTKAWNDLNQQEKLKGLDAKEVEEYGKHLQKTAKNSNLLSDSLENNAEAASDVAAETMRMNSGVDKLAKGFKDWHSVLSKSNSSSQEYFEAMSGMKDAMSDLLGINQEYISNEFITENFDLIKQAATGSAAAIDALALKASRSILVNILVNNELTEEKKAEILSTFDSMVSNLNIPEIKIGATIDDGDFLAKAQEIITQSGMTVAEANAMFDALGFEAKFKTEEQEVEQRNPITVTKTEVKGYTSGTATGPDGEERSWEYPILSTSTYNDGYSIETGLVDSFAMAVSPDGTEVPQIESITKTSSGAMNNYSSSNSGGPPPGGGGGGSKKAPKTEKAKHKTDDDKTKPEDEIERYYKITNKIEDLTRELNSLSNAKDDAWGPDKLAAMDKEIAKLKQVRAANKQYRDEIAQNLSKDKAKAEGYGVQIGTDGIVSNYEEIITQWVADKNAVVVDEYNSYEDQIVALKNQANAIDSEADEDGSQKQALEDQIDILEDERDKKIEAAEDLYDSRMQALEQYEDTRDLLADTNAELEEQLRQIQQLNYEKLMYKVEYKIEVNDSELNLLNKKLEAIEKTIFKDIEAFGLLGENFTQQYKILVDGEGNGRNPYEMYEGQFTELQELYELGKTDPENGINQDQFMQGLSETMDGLSEAYDTIVAMDEKMQEYYANAIEDGLDLIHTYEEGFDGLLSTLDHYSNVMVLIGQEKNYEGMNTILEGRVDILNDRIESAERTITDLEGQKALIEAELAKPDIHPDTKAFWEEQLLTINSALRDEQDALYGYVEEVGEAANQILKNNIDKAMKELRDSITGGINLDYLMKNMERMSTYQEDYLTNTNKMYETNKMISQAQLAIDKTQNAQAKQRYQEYIKYIEKLQTTEQLSKQELEMAQAKYAILEAEIALEEAKNAKSEVRLTRDSEGNFGYVYTADQDNIASATQTYLDKQNELYNISLEGSKQYREKYFENIQNMLDEVEALEYAYLVDHSITQEEYEKQKLAIQEYYSEQGKSYASLAYAAQWELAASSYSALMTENDLFNQAQLSANKEHQNAMAYNDAEYIGGLKTNMSGMHASLEEDLKQFNMNSYTETDTNYIKTLSRDQRYYSDLEKEAEQAQAYIYGQMTNPSANSAAHHMNEFASTTGTAFTSCETAATHWENMIKPLNERVGKTFSGDESNEGLAQKIKDATDESEGLRKKLNDKGGLHDTISTTWIKAHNMTAEWEVHRAKINEVKDSYFNLMTQIQNTMTAMANFNGANAPNTVSSDDIPAEYTTPPSSNENNNTNNNSGNDNGNTSNVEAQASDLAKEAEEIVKGVHNGTIPQTNGGWRPSARSMGYSEDAISLALKAFNDSKAGGGYSYYYEEALKLVRGYDTGGYTGAWGPEGKLAVLHEKELVLNKEDTENFLGGITILREISKALDTKALMASLGTIDLAAMTVGGAADQLLQQEVTIHADFPNVTDHNEIEMAIDNLINAASQYANRK